MLLFSIAFSVMISGHEAYINACSSQNENRAVCECQANFLAHKISDDKILQLAVAGSNALRGKTDKMHQLMKNSPDIVVALQKLEQEAANCHAE